MEHFQIAIIGGGPGGYVAAIRAAQNGFKTILVEKDWIGGTCLNIGCIPTKTLVKDAEILHEIRNAKLRGILVNELQVDMPKVIREKERVVGQLSRGVAAILAANGVDVRNGKAVITSKNSLIIDCGAGIEFENLIIATGSSNFIPPIPGLTEDGILTSTEALALQRVPESMAIIGGGVIGCELATVFVQFGTKVTIVEMMPNIVPTMDKDVSKELKRRLSAMGIGIRTDSCVAGVEREGDHWKVIINAKKSEVLQVADVLVSVGRRANLAGLEALKLELERGYIKTNEQMQTNLPGVYAIGDVTGKIQLAHVASAQGIVAADHIAGKAADMQYNIVPSCIYTIPEIGSVGLTEDAVRNSYGDDVMVSKFPMAACGKAQAMGSTNGFTKLVAQKSTGKLLGCHIVGPSATEIIGEAVAVMHFGGTVQDIAHTIHAHPTVSECVMEAAHLIMNEPIHLPPSK